MTWYAHNLYLPATERALEVLRPRAELRPFLYVVRDLRGFPWFKSEVRHDLGAHGLAAIRPVCSFYEDSADWYREPVLPWDSLSPETSGPPIESYVEEHNAPPQSLLQTVRDLSTRAGVPAVYYSAFLWGGDIEFEAAWTFSPEQRTYITNAEPGSHSSVRCIDEAGREQVEPGDALTRAMKVLGVHLPTPFFALHTRSFRWEQYQFK